MRIIQPNWPVANNIHAFTTTRKGGVSTAPFNDFNLGDHVGDDKSTVKINRALLVEKFTYLKNLYFSLKLTAHALFNSLIWTII